MKKFVLAWAVVLALCSLAQAQSHRGHGHNGRNVVIVNRGFNRAGFAGGFGGYYGGYGYAAPAVVVQQAPLVTYAAPPVAVAPAVPDVAPSYGVAPLAVAPTVLPVTPALLTAPSYSFAPAVYGGHGYGFTRGVGVGRNVVIIRRR